MAQYIFYVAPHGPYAKTKGIAGTGRNERGAVRFCFEANSNQEAFAIASRAFLPDDKRPLAGKSYIKPRKYAVGSRVWFLQPYTIGYRENGERLFADHGTIVEMINERYFGVKIEGYGPMVDFDVSELA